MLAAGVSGPRTWTCMKEKDRFDMIDLHNHILPGMDDGAADLDESLAIARQFLAEGVTRIVATPHVNPVRDTGPTAEEVRTSVAALREALVHAGIDLEVLPGSEIFLTPEVPELVKRGEVASLGGGSAVLVELPFDRRPAGFEHPLAQLVDAGYQPVLAHPERYAFVQRDPAALDSVVDRGVVLQLTAPAFLGQYGDLVRRTARQLLRQGCYGLASSDRHHPGPERSLAVLHKQLSDEAYKELADLLLRTNPARLLSGENIVCPHSELDAELCAIAGPVRGE